ncbi:primosomal protein N' [Paraferrimonas sedimenticola]|uniref:Replication restart protein PriA n=1 Tax=Paraferrimonas sedimenticola TaxID=375674 RepID=A0AA37RYQ7_9GAMM|nr:primosomal protein N' [Paraferrimonas sedimenticola]GLP97424.1 primosomal protein N' [Paraferrimonas sedimenticola]
MPETKPLYVEVALAVPLRQVFCYQVPAGQAPAVVGARVLVRFGPRTQVGLVTRLVDTPDFDVRKIKPYLKVLDAEPLFPESLLKLSQWAARYYFAPLGQMLTQALPVALRQDARAELASERFWQLTLQGQEFDLGELNRAKQQQALLRALSEREHSDDELGELGFSKAVIKALQDKQLIQADDKPYQPDLSWREQLQMGEEPLELNTEQAIAVAQVNQGSGFQPYLLEGVTGSGKTEVYLSLIQSQLEQGKQVLVLVPEIGLTPQTLARFQRRFKVPISVLHSALTPQQRLTAWLKARTGESAIIIGTRSALFTPMRWPGLIVLDEEHDLSFKQQDGVRYHARDLAVRRAHLEGVPVLLGSATPSLETLHNALNGRYQHLSLTQRAGNAKPPKNGVVDITHAQLEAGLSPALIERIEQKLKAGEQVLLFLNRRGYAPALMCHECGYLHECQRCDAFYTVHRANGEIHCHHCDDARPIPIQCANCSSTLLFGQGVGTEQLEEYLSQRFSDYPAVRIDRDSIRRKGELERRLEGIRSGKYRLLIGTQMLAKGHHFPDVTLVALLDVDGALFSADFRAPERLAQLITQVAGRAGRASKPGEVLLQTHQAQHPLIQGLLSQGYTELSRELLQERSAALLPPKQFMLQIQAEAHNSQDALNLLQFAAERLGHYQDMELLGPLPCAIERRAGKYRYQLLCQSQTRNQLQAIVEAELANIEASPYARKCRWNLDRDPQDLS